jgi:hypothetical protein
MDPKDKSGIVIIGDGHVNPILDEPILNRVKRCPICNSSDISWFCTKEMFTVPGPCGCEGTLDEGLCKCDQWVCCSCGYCLTKPFEGKKAIIQNGQVVNIVPFTK